MSIKTFLESFIQDVYPAFLQSYEEKKISLEGFKSDLITAISSGEWDDFGFPLLNNALIGQLEQIQLAEKPFIQEKEEVDKDGRFLVTALFKYRPSFEKGALIVNVAINDKRPLASMIADLQWIVDSMDKVIAEAKYGVYIMEITTNPLKEAFGQDVAGFVEVEEKSMKKR